MLFVDRAADTFLHELEICEFFVEQLIHLYKDILRKESARASGGLWIMLIMSVIIICKGWDIINWSNFKYQFIRISAYACLRWHGMDTI